MTKLQVISFLVYFINVLSNLVFILIFGRIIVSWLSMGAMGQRGAISRFFYSATEPILSLVRKIPHRIGMIDLSPLIALLALDAISYLLILLLKNLL